MSFVTRAPILYMGPAFLLSRSFWDLPFTLSVCKCHSDMPWTRPFLFPTVQALSGPVWPELMSFTSRGFGHYSRDFLSSSPCVSPSFLCLSDALVAGPLRLFLIVSIFLFLFSISLSSLSFIEISQLLILNFLLDLLKILPYYLELPRVLLLLLMLWTASPLPFFTDGELEAQRG